MGRSYLGECEELVLFTGASTKEEAYGAAITRGIQQKTGRLAVLRAVPSQCFNLSWTLSQKNLPFNSLFF